MIQMNRKKMVNKITVFFLIGISIIGDQGNTIVLVQVSCAQALIAPVRIDIEREIEIFPGKIISQ